MQFTPLDKEARASWRDMLEGADGARIMAAIVLFLASAIALPLSATEAVAGLYLLYAVAFYYMLTHSLAAVMVVGIPGMALYGISMVATALPHPFLLPAVYASLILGGIGGGFLLIHCREKKYLALLLLPVAAYGIAAAVAGPLQGLWVLLPVALSLVLGFGILNCCPQTPVLLWMAAVLALAALSGYFVWYALQGWPVANPFEYLNGMIRSGFESMFRAANALYAEQGMELALSDADAQLMAAVIGNVLPGLFLAGCAVLSFMIYRTNLRVLVSWGTLTRVPLRVGAMTISPIAAVLFILSYLISLFLGADLVGTVCENLSLVLEPALVLVGVTSLLGGGARRSKVSLFLLIGLVVLLLNYPTVALTAAAFLGAGRILLATIFGSREEPEEKE